MAKSFFSGWLAAAIAVYFILGARAMADAPLVYATIEPAQITLGESATYTITNLGDSIDTLSAPVVSGLKFEVMGRRRQIEFINGQMVPSSQIRVRVTPQIAGIFTIPALTPKSQPLVLQVNSPSNGTSSPKAAAVAPYRAPILSGAAMPKGIRLTEDGSAFLRLEVPKREVFVGEIVPVEIQLGMRSGFVLRVINEPRLTGDDFTINNLPAPERSEEALDGQPFVLATWRSVLAVVKPGNFSFSAEMPITVRIRTRPRRESLLDDQFGDPFLQNIFGASVPKDINVTSPPAQLKVLPLPAEGRPRDFHGAIGTFSIETDISPATADAGDPLTLRMRVTGSGNFDRVDSSMLDHVDQWKTYPPKSSFMTSDPTGRKGEKTFEQPLIALKPGVQSLPALSFSFFDPSTHRYETVRSAPLSVNITPSLADRSLTAPPKAGGAASAAIDQGGSGLRPDHAVDETSADSLTPLYLQPRFLTIPSLLALAFAGAWLAVRRGKDPTRKASRGDRAALKAANRVLAAMQAAARGGEVALFFGLARSSMQEVLAARWQIPAEQVTTAEVADRVGEDGVEIRQLFALADESNYSGNKLGSIDFARWMRIVRRQLLAGRTA